MSRLLLCAALLAQTPDPVWTALDSAYQQLRARHFDQAIASFQHAITLAPHRPDIRKDLAYTLLKIGEQEAARDQFAEAARLDPADHHVALEYAFLCHETRQTRIARLVFDRVRKTGDPASRATAEQAFHNIDRPLEEGIARWREAVEREPGNFSAHNELAGLAEQRDDWPLAARHYEIAWRLKPSDRSLLLDLGRAWRHTGSPEQAQAALLAASRGPEPRIAETARELLGPRYPYVYEFHQAIALDPDNAELKRELTYLLLEMEKKQDQPRDMAERGYQAGHLKDALKYFTVAHDADPVDFSLMLKLGYTHNLLKQDRQAVSWFALARRSPDPTIAAEAQRAYRNLAPQFGRFRTTAWLLPFYSSRWNDAFSYGQVKTEVRLASFPVRPYLSMRFLGDARGQVHQPYPQYLSESAFVFGLGAATPYYKGLMAWGEAGRAVSYLARRGQSSRQTPDYRGGVSFSRAFGRLLGSEKPGVFFENHEDGIYVSRFNQSVLLYAQNKLGYTVSSGVQLYWNANFTADARGQYWANFAETGPGLRLRWRGLPDSMLFSLDMLRGAHTINRGNPRRPNYVDVRAGFWYAFAR